MFKKPILELYVWTCLRGTPYAQEHYLFEDLTATLYEQRWHEVVTFCRKLQRRLAVLRRTWDAQRFLARVVLDGRLQNGRGIADR
eukprot:15329048-Alexandrium_andersonii.AAC.1